MSNSSNPALSAAARSKRPERWSIDAGDAALAQLVIPPDARRERRFEISCAMTVRRVEDAESAWHRLTVSADGRQQWQRRVETHPGTDGLDYRFEQLVPPGQGLRVGAEAACTGAVRRSLMIEADEVLD